MFTGKNAALVALLQTGVIVVGTLAAGLSSRIWSDFGLNLPTSSFLLVNFGPLLFLVPLGWIIFVMSVKGRVWISEDAKLLAFWSGLALVGALILFELYAIFRPWLFMCMMGTGSTWEME